MASATKTVQKHYKKFCSYCKAKGLPESAFTSHFVKDKPGKGGKVCCPELLKNECGYCHDIGHTPRFCPKLKARNARRAHTGKPQAVTALKAPARVETIAAAIRALDQNEIDLLREHLITAGIISPPAAPWPRPVPVAPSTSTVVKPAPFPPPALWSSIPLSPSVSGGGGAGTAADPITIDAVGSE